MDSTAFSFLLFSFYLYVCILLFYLSVWFFSWVRFVLSSVSRVVITDCSSLVNFLRICVITPCYVIIFVMFCYLLYCKLIEGNCNSLFTCTATDEGHRPKRLFIKFFIILKIFTIYIFVRSKLSVLVLYNNFKLSSRGLDCESFRILLAQHLCWLEAF